MRKIVTLPIARPLRRNGEARRRHAWSALLVSAFAAGVLIPSAGAHAASARASAPQPPAAMQHANSKGKPSAAHKQKTMKPAPGEPAAAPAAPPAPQWPVNDPPTEAALNWSAQGLTIKAKNSSLRQILDAVSARTGTKIEGFDADERVFGVYGPAQPREVLTQLLEGTAYNVIMVGNGAQGAPQEIMLSEKPKGGPQPNAPVSAAEEYQPPIAPYRPPQPLRPPQAQHHPEDANRPPQVPRTPQQILQELQQREQQLREQQIRQQEQNQHP